MSGRDTRTYTVDAAGWVAGRWRKAGAEIALTPAEAKYERVTPVQAPKRAPARKPRTKAKAT